MALALALAAFVLDAHGVGRRLWYPRYLAMAGPRSVETVLGQVGPAKRRALRASFETNGLPYPPSSLTLVAYKQERRLEVWPSGPQGWKRVRAYAVLAASGEPGPKLREGDGQVPEGLYRLTALNPNSSYHLSIRVDYPNEFDRARGREDGRSRLGGDIFIHGKAVSIGCLAIGDDAIEELFTLVADTGLANARVIIAPAERLDVPANSPAWVAELYRRIERELRALR